MWAVLAEVFDDWIEEVSAHHHHTLLCAGRAGNGFHAVVAGVEVRVQIMLTDNPVDKGREGGGRGREGATRWCEWEG